MTDGWWGVGVETLTKGGVVYLLQTWSTQWPEKIYGHQSDRRVSSKQISFYLFNLCKMNNSLGLSPNISSPPLSQSFTICIARQFINTNINVQNSTTSRFMLWNMLALAGTVEYLSSNYRPFFINYDQE